MRQITKNNYLWWILLLSATFHHSSQAANYLPIGVNGAPTESARMAIALPQGFKPQAPPIKPMLFPFVTPTPSSPSGGWKPIVGSAVLPPPPLAPPPLATLQDRIDKTSPGENNAPIEGPLLETIVYGTWKPEPPLSPDEIHSPTRRPSATPTTQNSVRKPTTASLEDLGLQHPLPNLHTDEVELIQKNGRRRIVTAHAQPTATTPLKAVIVNMSDPSLFEMAKQINNSLAGITSYPTQKPKIKVFSQNTEEISGYPAFEEDSEPESNTDNIDLDASKVWPTDFIASLERGSKPNSTQNFNISFIGDSSDPPQALNGLSIPSSLLPQISLNITKVGVPYEKQSSAEELTLCVPLTVLEQLSRDVVMEVERVYCFPLPSTHTGAPKPKSVTAKVENFTEYEAVSAAKSLCWDYAHISSLSLIILFYQKLKYS
ncbi:uncharacterized protein LOC101454785 [Ceratitis capitata]|uniref:uncharacterized protein LOC101454785 n=1 Tax=Ceratitis capitata TaxID=7213 RepID=UPI00032A2A6B|nr:uncharacterized protein LOC101454785 [Ceratitis capitata]